MPLKQEEIDNIVRHFGEIGSFEITPITEVVGFQGVYYRLRIEKKCGTSTYFVKTVPKGSDIVNDFYRRSGTFRKEAGMYEKIFPLLNEVKRSKLWPDCLLADERGYIVLEDMNASGWEMASNMDFDHVQSVLRSMAEFHACTLNAAREKDLGLLTASILDETMFSSEDRPGREMWNAFCRLADDILPRKGVFATLQRVVDKVKPSEKFRNCLNHGDPWINNMFFKYDRGRPCEVVFVDFQSSRWAPPALDLAIFAHIVAPNDVDRLARIYYNNLIFALDKSNCSPLPANEFWESLGFYRSAGVGIAALYTFLTRLPQKYMGQILTSQDAFIPFALGRDYSPALKALDEIPSYRGDFVQALERVVKSSDQ